MKRITIDPVTRIEGHAKITIQLDDDGRVTNTEFHVTQVCWFLMLVPHLLRSTFLLISGQNSDPRLLARPNPSVIEPWMNPRRAVLSRSGYHWLERNAAP